uniref:Uncharacterized protein n=1 Tax=viral metagenome TaxID=1070528 RepID=A0A6C0IHV5_9ZZZZ
MSWGTSYSGSNNIHFNFPPIMSDGRNFASWQPEAVVNKRIQQQEKITTNWNYRQYMQQNGLQIMQYNTAGASYELGVDPHTQVGTTPSENVPYMFKSTFDSSKPGYGYNDSNLKNPYLSREQLNAKLISPHISANDIRN